MNPILSVLADGTKAVAQGTISVGEKIDVTIGGLGSVDIPAWEYGEPFVGSSLRIRIVDNAGCDLARFPKDGTETWEMAGDSYVAKNVELNTVGLRRVFAGVAYGDKLQFGLILDSAKDHAQYARGKVYVQQWAVSRLDDPTVIPDWNDVLRELKRRVDSTLSSETLAIQARDAALTARESAVTASSQAVASAQEASATKREVAVLKDAAENAKSAAETHVGEAERWYRQALVQAQNAKLEADMAKVSADTAKSVMEGSVKKAGDTMTGTLAVPAVTLNGVDLETRIASAKKSAEQHADALVEEERRRATDTEKVISDNLAAEIEFRKQADLALAQGLGRESSRAEAAELANADAIAAEKARAESEEETLRSLIDAVKSFGIIVVGELPPVGEEKIIYLVPSASEGKDNVKDEYLWIDEKWERIGSTAVDVKGYAKSVNDQKPDTQGNVRLLGTQIPVDNKNGKTITEAVTAAYTEALSKYEKPAGGIPKGDLATDVLPPVSVVNDNVEITVAEDGDLLIRSAGNNIPMVRIVSKDGKRSWRLVDEEDLAEKLDKSDGIQEAGSFGLSDGSGVVGFFARKDGGIYIGTAGGIIELPSFGKGVVALTTDIPAVVTPSASATTGQAADAKATHEALTGKCDSLKVLESIEVGIYDDGDEEDFRGDVDANAVIDKFGYKFVFSKDSYTWEFTGSRGTQHGTLEYGVQGNTYEYREGDFFTLLVKKYKENYSSSTAPVANDLTPAAKAALFAGAAFKKAVADCFDNADTTSY